MATAGKGGPAGGRRRLMSVRHQGFPQSQVAARTSGKPSWAIVGFSRAWLAGLFICKPEPGLAGLAHGCDDVASASARPDSGMATSASALSCRRSSRARVPPTHGSPPPARRFTGMAAAVDAPAEKRLFIAGASGWLGRCLVQAAVQQGMQASRRSSTRVIFNSIPLCPESAAGLCPQPPSMSSPRHTRSQVTAMVRASSDTGGVLQHEGVRLVVGDADDPGSIRQEWFEGVGYVASALGLRRARGGGLLSGCTPPRQAAHVRMHACGRLLRWQLLPSWRMARSGQGIRLVDRWFGCRSLAITDAELARTLRDGTLAIFRRAPAPCFPLPAASPPCSLCLLPPAAALLQPRLPLTAPAALPAALHLQARHGGGVGAPLHTGGWRHPHHAPGPALPCHGPQCCAGGCHRCDQAGLRGGGRRVGACPAVWDLACLSAPGGWKVPRAALGSTQSPPWRLLLLCVLQRAVEASPGRRWTPLYTSRMSAGGPPQCVPLHMTRGSLLHSPPINPLCCAGFSTWLRRRAASAWWAPTRLMVCASTPSAVRTLRPAWCGALLLWVGWAGQRMHASTFLQRHASIPRCPAAPLPPGDRSCAPCATPRWPTAGCGWAGPRC